MYTICNRSITNIRHGLMFEKVLAHENYANYFEIWFGIFGQRIGAQLTVLLSIWIGNIIINFTSTLEKNSVDCQMKKAMQTPLIKTLTPIVFFSSFLNSFTEIIRFSDWVVIYSAVMFVGIVIQMQKHWCLTALTDIIEENRQRERLARWLWIGNSCTYYSVNAAILFCLLSQYQIVYWSESPSFIQKATRPNTQMNTNDNRPLQYAFIVTHRNLSEVFNSLHGIYSALHHLTLCIFSIYFTHIILMVFAYHIYVYCTWLLNCTNRRQPIHQWNTHPNTADLRWVPLIRILLVFVSFFRYSSFITVTYTLRTLVCFVISCDECAFMLLLLRILLFK